MLYNNIKQLRKAKGIKQEELANKTGVRRETIIRLEQNKYNPSLELAMKICNVLNSDINSTFTLLDHKITEEPAEEEKKLEKQIDITEEYVIDNDYNLIDKELLPFINDINKIDDISDFLEYKYIQDERYDNKEINNNIWAFMELIYSRLDYTIDNAVQNALKTAINIRIERKKRNLK